MAGYRRLLDEPDSAATQGDLPYYGSGLDITRLAAGTDGKVLTTHGAGADPTWETPSSGAPTDAQYLTLATNATLTQERVATAGSGIAITDAGAGSTATFALDVAGLTAGNIADPDSDYVPVSDASAGALRKWTPDMFVPKGYHFGLTLSNNSTDPTNDIDIAAGVARDSTDVTTLRLASGITKRLDAAWAVGTNQGGLDTGAIANDVYHVWLIMRSDTGVVDVLFSASATAPTMPANYDYKRRIGSIIRVSAAILLFTQVAHHFVLAANSLDVDVTNLGSGSRTLYTLTVPDGIKVWADIRILAPTGGENTYGTSPDQNDESVSTVNNRTSVAGSNSNYQERILRTNTSGQIGLRGLAANTDVRVSTFGWWDFMEDA